MSEGGKTKIVLLDERQLEILVQVSSEQRTFCHFLWCHCFIVSPHCRLIPLALAGISKNLIIIIIIYSFRFRSTDTV